MANKDWLPKPRQDILTMAKNWSQIIGGSATVKALLFLVVFY
jgi:hypothetical protein